MSLFCWQGVYPWFARLQRGVLPAARISGEKTLPDAFFHSGIDAQRFFFGQRLPFWRRSVINCMPADLPRELFWQEAEWESGFGAICVLSCVSRLHSACSFVLSHRVTDDVDDNNNGPTTLCRPVTTAAFSHRTRRGLTSFNYNNSSHSLSNNLQPFCPLNAFADSLHLLKTSLLLQRKR